MELGTDLLHSLVPDMSLKVLMYLDDPLDAVRVGSVSHAWRAFVISNSLCKRICLRLFPQLSNVVHVVDIINRAGVPANVGSSRSSEWEHQVTEHRIYASLARSFTSSEVGECILEAIAASSTDNYPEESIDNTMEPRDQVGRIASYWSSSGQSNPEVPEKLTYRLISDFCIINEISVQPFQAFFQPYSPIYSAKSVRFRMGHRILSDDSGADHPMKEMQPADDQFVWTYTSPEFPMAQENSLQKFKLPQPVLCVGGFLQIELLGRVQRQEMDSLFYICIAHVRVLGLSLSPDFSAEITDPSGKFMLKYNPNAKLFVPRATEYPDEVHGTSAVVPETVHRQVRGWEQILNLLRGNLGAGVYDVGDEDHESDDEELAELFIA